MFTKIYWLHAFHNAAKLGIMARPRGNDWLEDEINHLKNNNVGILVSLLEKDEIRELKLELEGEFCKAKAIDFINFPIPDISVPTQKDKVDALINTLTTQLNDGISVVIHCRMGIGRSSIIAAAILLKFGFKPMDIIDNISFIRGLKVPDTEEQLQWLIEKELIKK
jgi:protein-tyrosine phosphatase